MEKINSLLPVIFFGHDNPMNGISNNKFTKSWLQITKNISKPKGILVISAHYQTYGTKITNNQKQKTIHDFGGFPQQLFQVQYTPNGDRQLVKQIVSLIPQIKADDKWGLDHGSWTILKHIYPKADIPVLQLSLDRNKKPSQHYQLAKKLYPLRQKGILIMGSGNIVHNLYSVIWQDNAKPYKWAVQFNNLIK